MRQSVKAFLFSFLIFPGTGHFALGRYQRGLIFMLPALISMFMLLQNAMAQIDALSGQIMQGITPQANETASMQYASWIFMICWIASIIDAVRLGRLADKSAVK